VRLRFCTTARFMQLLWADRFEATLPLRVRYSGIFNYGAR